MTAHTDADLVQALGHIGYEVWMMTQAATRLGSGDCDEIAGNAYLETTLLHARALADFLVVAKDGRHASDIKRTDFAGEWRPEPNDAAERIRSKYEQLHNYLGHLSWDRVDKSKPSWAYRAITEDLVAIADRWGTLLAGNRRLFNAFRPWVTWSLDLLSAAPADDPDVAS